MVEKQRNLSLCEASQRSASGTFHSLFSPVLLSILRSWNWIKVITTHQDETCRPCRSWPLQPVMEKSWNFLSQFLCAPCFSLLSKRFHRFFRWFEAFFFLRSPQFLLGQKTKIVSNLCNRKPYGSAWANRV